MILSNIFRKKSSLLAVVFLFILSSPVWPQTAIDMTDSFLKLQQPVMIYDMGAEGFGVYDTGDAKMKFFNWDYKLNRQFPLPKGEGPGEIKSIVLSACPVAGKIYVLGLFEKKIIVFDSQGGMEKEIPLEFRPKEIIARDNKLYAFSLNINAVEESFPLGAVIDPQTGKKIKEIVIKSKLVTKKIPDGNPTLLGMSSTIDVTDSGEIFLLISSANILAVCGSDGEVLYKKDLPYEERKVIQKVKEEHLLSVLDWYPDMRAFNDSAYVCFLKTLKKNKAGETQYQTVIIKVNDKEKMKEKVLAGNYIIIGQHNDQLQLFETEEYKIVGVKLGEWD